MLYTRLPKEFPAHILAGAKKKGTVFVGMSGGVDSSTSALLLKEQGYDVVGVFIKVWSPDWLPQLRQGSTGQACNWREEQRDAMRVAAEIDIPFFTFDLEEDYKRDVVDYMIAEYKLGRTPNPDVMCNRSIKFGSFWRKARDMGAEFIATGHYARIKKGKGERGKGEEKNILPFNLQPSTHNLLAGADPAKDQSYFLWTLTQDDLSHTLFPIGRMQKSEVRAYAKEKGLSVADKKDSQGICFLGQIDLKEFLKYYLKPEPGKVLDEAGKELGTHEGAILYTIGEAIPLGGLAAKHFVITKDIEKNTVTVSVKRPSELESAATEVTLKDVNWVSAEPDASKKYQARVRYRQELQEVEILSCQLPEKTAFLRFKNGQIIASGQSVVIYLPAQAGENEICLGGGIIS